MATTAISTLPTHHTLLSTFLYTQHPTASPPSYLTSYGCGFYFTIDGKYLVQDLKYIQRNAKTKPNLKF